jgi:ABC-2 type transport system permease protein
MQAVGRSFQNLWNIASHEFQTYFLSPIIYMIGGIWLFIGGAFFALTLENLVGPNGSGGGDPSMANTLSPMFFLMMFLAPAFTMRLLSEEFRAGTHELLFTAPVRDWEIVVGKWLGAWMVMTILIIITLLFPLVLFLGGNPDPGPIIAGYIGFWLWTGAALAIGVLTSSFTQHQLVALFAGIGVILFLWLAYLAGQFNADPVISDIFTQLTVSTHYQTTMLQSGQIDPVDITYFISIIAISLFTATQIVSSRRWRA